MEKAEVRDAVRKGYAEVASERKTGCCQPTCCSPVPETDGTLLGYSEEDLSGPAAVGNLGLGCGNPTALAELKPGETVVDLGSGAGFDALLSAKQLGPTGRFIGIEMTPEMLARARKNAIEAGYAETVEFREGLIEALPVVSETVDVVISNCVINLSPDKSAAFSEAFRVLKPGGRLAVSDIVLSEPLPEPIQQSVAALVACVAGAETEDAYLGYMREAGFVDITFERVPAGNLFDIESNDPMLRAAIDGFGIERAKEIAGTVYSYAIRARKPA